MLRKNRRPTNFRLGTEKLEVRAVLSGVPIHVDTFSDVIDPNDDVTSLREAIVLAVSTDHDDLILLPAGQYDLELGELQIVDAPGKLVIQSSGATIDAHDQGFRVLGVSGSETEVELNGLTITGGRDTAADGSGLGGGILNDGSRLTINNSLVTGNVSNDGGGIQNRDGGVLLLENSVVSNNRSEDSVINHGNGGGIMNLRGTLIVMNSQVNDNVADRNTAAPPFFTGALGGGIVSIGSGVAGVVHSTTIINSSLSGNSADGGGGGIAIGSLGASSGTLTVINSTITDNTAAELDPVPDGPRLERGGGILAVGIFGGTNDVTLINSRVTGNQAHKNGGGIASAEIFGGLNNLTLINSRVADNNAGLNGGGIAIESPGTLTLYNSRVTDNESGTDGGGIWIVNAQSSAVIVNSWISRNSTGHDGGGIWNAGQATLLWSRIEDNAAGNNGGGVLNEGDLDLIFSRIAGNDAQRAILGTYPKRIVT